MLSDESKPQSGSGRLFAASPLICVVLAWVAAWLVISSGTSGLAGEARVMAWVFGSMVAAAIVLSAAVVGSVLGVWLLIRDDARPSTIVGLALNLLTLLAAAAFWRPQ
jgi:hypothetical protein